MDWIVRTFLERITTNKLRPRARHDVLSQDDSRSSQFGLEQRRGLHFSDQRRLRQFKSALLDGISVLVLRDEEFVSCDHFNQKLDQLRKK